MQKMAMTVSYNIALHIALHWATSFICDAGPVLLSEVVRTIDDGQIDGSTKVCKYLISLRTAAGTIDNLMTTFELMRAQCDTYSGSSIPI